MNHLRETCPCVSCVELRHCLYRLEQAADMLCVNDEHNSHAVCYVDARAVGMGTGADWPNAMITLPHTLVHGMIYMVRG